MSSTAGAVEPHNGSLKGSISPHVRPTYPLVWIKVLAVDRAVTVSIKSVHDEHCRAVCESEVLVAISKTRST